MSSQVNEQLLDLEEINESIDPEEIQVALEALNAVLLSVRSQTIQGDLRNAYDRISRLVVWEI